ncbi:MAG: lycopene cyclase domain-containing protein [Alphaproteobacteria bacterium]
MIDERYVWLVWSSAFLVPWAVAFLALPAHRTKLMWTSLFTAPFGLTEPIFVPTYWNPPSLFDLAQATGFDIESVIFCFGIGGIGSALYDIITNTRLVPVGTQERARPLHRHHYFAIGAPFLAFPALYALPWNPIYPAILATFVGAAATMACRRDLATKTWVGGALFLGFYAVYLLGLEGLAPGYIARVWNLADLTGVVVARMPLEELLFAVAFGMYWAGAYEHFTWRGVSEARTRTRPDASASPPAHAESEGQS